MKGGTSDLGKRQRSQKRRFHNAGKTGYGSERVTGTARFSKENPRHSGVHMRKQSVLLGFMASGAIVLGTFAATLPANAASLPSSTASPQGSTSAGSLSPATKGSILCNDDICLQRITSVVNGKATVEAWAYTRNFTGDFNLSGTGYDETSPTQTWVAGGAGHDFTGVPAEGGLLLQAWQNDGDSAGVITFAVN